MSYIASVNEREMFLLQYAAKLCSNSSDSKIDFDDSWNIIRAYGLDVIQNMIKEFILLKRLIIVQQSTQSSQSSSTGNQLNKFEEKPFGSKGYSSLYTIAYKLVISHPTSKLSKNDCSMKIYHNLIDFIAKHLSSSDVQDILNERDSITLYDFVSIWQSFKLLLKWISLIFNQLENLIVILDLQTIACAGILLFYENIYLKHHVFLSNLTVKELEMGRIDSFIDQDLVKESIEIYMAMGIADYVNDHKVTEEENKKLFKIDQLVQITKYSDVYIEDFEKHYLLNTKMYYEFVSNEWLDRFDIAQYMEMVAQAIKDEVNRAFHLNAQTRTKLKRICLETCILSHKTRLLDIFMEILWKVYDNSQQSYDFQSDHRVVIIRSIVGIFEQVQSLEKHDVSYHLVDQMFELMKTYLLAVAKRNILNEISNNTVNNDTLLPNQDERAYYYITNQLKYFKYSPILIKMIFPNAPNFSQLVQECLTDAVNNNVLTGNENTAQQLALFADAFLKGKIKSFSDGTEETILLIMDVFKKLLDKDLFAEKYRQLLSKRLLLKRSAESECESFIISQLKMQCGAQFTSKLEGMLNDLNVATQIQCEYNEYINNTANNNNSNNIYNNDHFEVLVLTLAYWPSCYKVYNAIIPDILLSQKQQFIIWYNQNYQSRLLTWNYYLGEVQMKVIMPSSPSSSSRNKSSSSYEVTITTVQAI
eukprot:gene11415-15298_t